MTENDLPPVPQHESRGHGDALASARCPRFNLILEEHVFLPLFDQMDQSVVDAHHNFARP
jgi:hypothetical protein